MDPQIHSFIIRIWRESVDHGTFIWRGHITHVPDGVQRYLKNLDHNVAEFIAPYLAEMGIQPAPRGLKRWWVELRRRLSQRNQS